MWRGLALADLSAIRYIVIRWGILEFARRLDDRTRAATILWEGRSAPDAEPGPRTVERRNACPYSRPLP